MVTEKYIKYEDIAPMLESLSRDITCPIHIAAELAQIIGCIPVVEAREATYGVWLDAGKNICNQDLTRCSVCGSVSISGGKFCRCCGAIMKQ